MVESGIPPGDSYNYIRTDTEWVTYTIRGTEEAFQ